MVCNSLLFVSCKDYKAFTRDLKAIYNAATEAAGFQPLEAFSNAWDRRYTQISPSWQENRGLSGHVIRVRSRHPQGYLHDQRPRVAKQHYHTCHQKAQGIPYG